METFSNKQLVSNYYNELEKIVNISNDKVRKNELRRFIIKFYEEKLFDEAFQSNYDAWGSGFGEVKFTSNVLAEEILDIDQKKSVLINKLGIEVIVLKDNQTPMLKEYFPGYWYKKGFHARITSIFRSVIENGKISEFEIELTNYKEQIMGTQQWANLYLNQNVDVDKYLEFIRGKNLIN